jgi:hypothetical protein
MRVSDILGPVIRPRPRVLGGTARRAAGRTSARLALVVLLVSLAAATAPGAVAASNPAAPAAAPPTAAVCGPAAPGYYSCLSLRRTDIAARARSQVTPLQLPGGFGPADLQSAYGLTTAAASGDGAGETVAIVDAYDQPNAFADVNQYRTTYGIPALVAYGSGSSGPWFQKVNETGGTTFSTNTSWNLETSLDIDMVSAICPNCNILLVEGNSASFGDLGTAVNYAANETSGTAYGPVVAISNSYGTSDFAGESLYDSLYYNHPGIAVTAATGDSGYGLLYPASSKDVVAVGGTALTSVSPRTETAWSDAGSGCSSNESKPSWQADYGCPKGRTAADVSAVASCSTPVAVYDSVDGGWIEVCGTSVASPIIASTFALAGAPGATPAKDLYDAPAYLNDVTSVSNGTCSPAYLCTAEVGYDGPTGLGTPNGIGAFTSSAATAPDAPMNVTATAGNGQATVSFSPPAASGGTAITSYTATSNPGGFTNTGTPTATSITVTGLTNGTAYTFTVTATNGTGPGEVSTPSNSVTPTATTATVPGAPTIGTATAGNAQATVSFSPPASNGGSPITSYTATSSPGSKTATGTPTATSITVTGLTNGTAYTFTVKATNAVGSSSPSAASNSVTPTGPLTITTTSLASGRLNRAYSATLKATGGVSPYTWTITAGTLPTGLTLAASTGTISGTPTKTGTVSFTVTVTDSTKTAVSKALSITISSR